MRYQILGVGIDKINLVDSLKRINDFVNSDTKHYVVTVNPEFLVAANKNNNFKKVLNKASLSVCDGIGLRFVSFGKLIRVTGVELSRSLLKDKHLKIFLLGGSAKSLHKKMHGNIVGSLDGGVVNVDNWQLSDNDQVIESINNSGAHILLVGFGQVKQEMWIDKNLQKLRNIKVAIGVGGTFDYLSGNVSQPPKVIRSLGLEWFFRLLTQPARIGRIFNATFVFLWLFIFKRSK